MVQRIVSLMPAWNSRLVRNWGQSHLNKRKRAGIIGSARYETELDLRHYKYCIILEIWSFLEIRWEAGRRAIIDHHDRQRTGRKYCSLSFLMLSFIRLQIVTRASSSRNAVYHYCNNSHSHGKETRVSGAVVLLPWNELSQVTNITGFFQSWEMCRTIQSVY